MPTQMGSTASEPGSLRITMGMLVTGSIIRPRIFISTSIVSLLAQFPAVSGILRPDRRSQPAATLALHHHADKTIWKTLRDLHANVRSRRRGDAVRGGEVQRLV